MKKQNLILVAVLATAFAATGAEAGAADPSDADFTEYWMSGADAGGRNVTDVAGLDADFDLFEVTGDPDRYSPVEVALDPIFDADLDMGLGEIGRCETEAEMATR